MTKTYQNELAKVVKGRADCSLDQQCPVGENGLEAFVATLVAGLPEEQWDTTLLAAQQSALCCGHCPAGDSLIELLNAMTFQRARVA